MIKPCCPVNLKKELNQTVLNNILPRLTIPYNNPSISLNLSSMTLLYPSLIRLIERAIQSPVKGYSISMLNEPESVWPRLGRHFSIQKENTGAPAFPWFGIYDTAMGPIIYIGISDNPQWCRPVYDSALKRQLAEGQSFRKPYIDLLRGELCFTLKEEKTGLLLLGQYGEMQEKMLLDFFTEVVLYLGEYLA
jgi:hypothetical protein